MAKRVTQKDIARICGLTPASVGCILNGSTKYKFRPETVEKVRRAAEKMHYRPNHQATSLRLSENKLLLCIVGSSCRYSDMYHIQCLKDEVEKRGYSMLVQLLVGMSDERKLETLRHLINMPAGIFIWSLGIRDKNKLSEAWKVLKNAPPALHLNHPMPGSGADYIDILWGGPSLPRLMNFFQKAKCRRVAACLPEQAALSGVQLQFPGLAAEYGMHGEVLMPENTSADFYESGRVLADCLLKQKTLPDGLYSVSDEMTLTMLDVFKSSGMKVPENMLIVSGGDSDFLQKVNPQIPFFTHDVKNLCSIAVEDIIKRVESGEVTSGQERCVAVIEQQIFSPLHGVLQ